jgi:hypothetical protein
MTIHREKAQPPGQRAVVADAPTSVIGSQFVKVISMLLVQVVHGAYRQANQRQCGHSHRCAAQRSGTTPRLPAENELCARTIRTVQAAVGERSIMARIRIGM